MAIYNPRQAPSRSRKGGNRPTKDGGLFGGLLRRKAKPAPFRAQPMVSGVQRARRWKRILHALVLFIVFGGLFLASLWGGAQLLFRSTIFRLTDIRVSGIHTVSQRQILDLAGLQQGGSLLRFNARAAEARVEAHPWVERAEIVTHWPSAVEIKITEFQPFALAHVEEAKEKRLRYVDRAGRLFSAAGQGRELDFPVITGVQAAKDVAGENFIKGSLAEAACTLLLLAAKGNAILPIQAVSEVHLDQQTGLILYLVDRPFPIYFGRDRLQTKYYRLVRVLEQLYAKKQVDAVKEIRMDYLDDKVLVTGVQIDG